MVMTVSNILRMLESLEVEGGRSTAAFGSTYSSAMGSPEEGGGGGATPDRRRLNMRAFRACSHLSSVLPKEGNTYGSYNVYRLKSKKLI